ncbi:sorting nexin-13-like isoform X2 [Lineus longissimus]|uniref:sorting nexin-13-like isoform X2 n=1 Tax=Lineus longissimus TaxID=88925 RepID=UPI00315C8F8B
MKVQNGTFGWVILGMLLFLGTFGLHGGFYLALYGLALILGAVVAFHLHGMTKLKEEELTSKYQRLPKPDIGIKKLVQEVRSAQTKYKTDKRLTGANIIDEVLQEVLFYLFRDYIKSWYRKISDHESFPHDIRLTMQRVIIAFSERSKQVEWVPYFTTRLVDDFASHLRLYRRSQEKVAIYRKDESKPPADLESIFFDLEVDMEDNITRDMICTDREHERQYLQDLSEVLLFLLLPPDDFNNKPFRYILREILVNFIFLPTIELVSDPDYVNQTIAWLCKETTFTNETFMAIIKMSDSIEELQAVKEKVDLDIARQRSRDTGGEDDIVIKAQLGSLIHVKEACELRIQRIHDGTDEFITEASGLDVSKLMARGQRLYSLPFDVVLNNNVALDCFMEFLTSIGASGYLSFYFNADGFRLTMEQQMNNARIKQLINGNTLEPDVENLREMAMVIYDQYLSEKSTQRIKLDSDLVKRTLQRIKNGPIDDEVFEEAQARVADILQEDKYFLAFQKSQMYIKLLAELDLLQDGNRSDTEDFGTTDDESLSSKTSSLHAKLKDLHNIMYHNQSTEDVASVSSCDSLSSTEVTTPTAPKNVWFNITARITQTGIAKDDATKKEFALYAVTVTKTNYDGSEEVWNVYRRYSDFHDLHLSIKERYDELSTLTFPGKKAFNNMNKEFLERRRKDLDGYLQTLLHPKIVASTPGLQDFLAQFLDPVAWEKGKSEFVRKMDTLVNPLKNSVRNVGNAVKAVPENFVDGVTKVSDGIKGIPGNVVGGFGKLFKGPNAPNMSTTKELLDSGKVGAAIDIDDDDNIPLRIMLLLMDEVFDLKHRNQWLRRRIVPILRQIIKATFGDMINRKIVDHVEWLTSSEQVAEYVKALRDALWPCGVPAEIRSIRDHNTKMRTRVVCKAKMLGNISDEIKTLMGSESTRLGVQRVFNLFQHKTLNKRLVYVFLEGFMETLFPENKFQDVFHKIHSQSPRVKTENAKDGRRSNSNKSGTRIRNKKTKR